MYDGTNQPPQQPPYDQPTAQYTPPTQGRPQPQPPYGQPQPQYGQPPYGPSPMYVQPQPQKRSLRWLWITLGIVGGLLVLACVGCGIVGALGYNFVAKAVGPVMVAGQYYSAVSKQDYTRAYSYLDTSSISVQGQTVTEQEYAQAAQVIDTAQGKVTKSSSTGFNVNNDTAAVTMQVTRTSGAYEVHLQLKKVGNDWKIVSMDRL